MMPEVEVGGDVHRGLRANFRFVFSRYSHCIRCGSDAVPLTGGPDSTNPEAARLIAHASDKKRARREVSESANRMWNGLRIDTTR